jgi:hypothetical protein
MTLALGAGLIEALAAGPLVTSSTATTCWPSARPGTPDRPATAALERVREPGGTGWRISPCSRCFPWSESSCPAARER